MPKSHRLKSEGDFAKLAKSRKSTFGKLVGLKVRENGLPHSRFGIVVGLKISKRATERNLLRRRIREIIRKNLPSIKGGYDVMVLANPAALKAGYEELAVQALHVFTKAGLRQG